MFVSLILVLLLAVGGMSLTYLIADDEPLLWRLSAGNIVGSAIFGSVCFLLACFFGFSALTISVALFISLAPLFLFVRPANRAKFQSDWRRAKGKLEGATFKKFLRFAYYIFFVGLFYLFFNRAIIETAAGIFTGGSQNYGDLPFHLGAIFSFTEGNNFPPENPSYAFAKFSYPFIADLITATFVEFGAASVRDAMLVQNVSLAFSLLVVLERFVFKLTGSRLAGKIAPVLLFFSGGLGFVWFVKDAWQSAQGFFNFIWALPIDYTIRNPDQGEVFRWGNSLVVLFLTQRGLLLGLPLTIVVLQKLWGIFCDDETTRQRDGETKRQRDIGKDVQFEHQISPSHRRIVAPSFLIGLLAGTLPLVHVHSLAVLFVVGAFLFFYRIDRWREWIAFAVGVSIIAVPELIWVVTGSATRLTEFVAWHFGWDKRDEYFLWFWIKNTGIFIPLLVAGIFLMLPPPKKEDAEDANAATVEPSADERRKLNLLLFFMPFLLCFIISNAVKLAPWEWDNIKVLIYWFVASLPFVAYALAWAWNRDKITRMAAVGALIVLTLAGALDVWRTISGAINSNVFNRNSVAIAQQIKQKTAPNALFLNAPTFNSAVVLSGRRSLMRFTGHLASYGIDFSEREAEVKRIYAGDATAEILLNKHGIEYVIISPEEKSNLTVNEDFFRRFPIIAQIGDYRVYQIKK